MSIKEREEDMGLWHQATLLHHPYGMIGNLPKPLPLLLSVTFFGPLLISFLSLVCFLFITLLVKAIRIHHNLNGTTHCWIFLIMKYNVFMAQIGCAAIGVLALTIFGPGWLARSASIGASVAYMIITNPVHPPACRCFSLMVLSSIT
ncbi:hypothetical protein GLYMA_05G030200v4 [Glycine max]|nr:hypothetical protein GLYMA_05G030200v4 [Glycine max]KAH1132549.1 hypothetical protein GYH30_011411 [Glycine max]